MCIRDSSLNERLTFSRRSWVGRMAHNMYRYWCDRSPYVNQGRIMLLWALSVHLVKHVTLSSVKSAERTKVLWVREKDSVCLINLWQMVSWTSIILSYMTSLQRIARDWIGKKIEWNEYHEQRNRTMGRIMISCNREVLVWVIRARTTTGLHTFPCLKERRPLTRGILSHVWCDLFMA